MQILDKVLPEQMQQQSEKIILHEKVEFIPGIVQNMQIINT